MERYDAEIQAEISQKHSMTADISHSGKIQAVIKLPTELGAQEYDGEYEVVPLAYKNVILNTKEKYLTDDITVNKVPYFETSNEYGTTVYIAGEI